MRVGPSWVSRRKRLGGGVVQSGPYFSHGLDDPQPPTSFGERPSSVLGGFKRSSQRLESEELRWKQGRFVGLIVRCGLRCGRLVVRRLGGVSIGSGFGKGSVVGCRARMLVWRLVCRLWLVRVGSARMVGWSLFLLYRFRGVICLLLSEKRLLFSTPASVGCVRSPASWADHRRRSHVSCAATPQPVVEAWSIGPRPHSGIRIGVPVAPRFPSWPPTTPSVNTFRIAWVG